MSRAGATGHRAAGCAVRAQASVRERGCAAAGKRGAVMAFGAARAIFQQAMLNPILRPLLDNGRADLVSAACRRTPSTRRCSTTRARRTRLTRWPTPVQRGPVGDRQRGHRRHQLDLGRPAAGVQGVQHRHRLQLDLLPGGSDGGRRERHHRQRLRLPRLRRHHHQHVRQAGLVTTPSAGRHRGLPPARSPSCGRRSAR